MSDWDFWTHGVNVQIQETIPGMEVVRYGWGTSIKRPVGRSWFHFAIPTPPQIDGDSGVELRDVFIRAQLKPNARITKVHVRDGRSHPITFPPPGHLDLNVREPNVVYNQPLPHQRIQEAVVVSIEVEFLPEGPEREVIFNAVGVRFNE